MHLVTVLIWLSPAPKVSSTRPIELWYVVARWVMGITAGLRPYVDEKLIQRSRAARCFLREVVNPEDLRGPITRCGYIGDHVCARQAQGRLVDKTYAEQGAWCCWIEAGIAFC